jgi:hypothetical protein
MAVSAFAQTKDDYGRGAYGSRIGDREQDPNNAGINGDRRTSKRLDTRINNRTNNRVDRFTRPTPNSRPAYPVSPNSPGK